MTASTHNNKKEKDKKNKKKWPIRTEFLGTIAVVVVLLGPYSKFFFDSHLKKGLEWTATYIHGAEVNIKDINSSFLGARFEMLGLEVTDKERPELNAVEVGKVRFSFLWDALLRAKFVVSEASILDIQLESPREKAGFIVPQKEYKAKSEALAKLEESVIAQGKEDFSGSALGDVVEILGGTDTKDQIKKIGGELKSEKKIKELETGLAKKEKQWRERIANIDHKQRLEQVTNKAKAIKLDKKKPWRSLKEYKAVLKEARLIFNDYRKISTDLESDVSAYTGGMKDIDKLIREDMGDIQKRFKVPNLNLSDFSKALFGKVFQNKVKDIYKYLEVAKEYMPPPGAGQKNKGLIPHARGQGRDYKFTVKGGYPLFWLKKGKISSKSNASDFSGDLDGEIIDITSDPVFLGKPALVNIKGNFPKQEISGVEINIILDHTKKIPTQILKAKVNSYPIKARSLSDSEKLKLSIKSAKGEARLNAEIKGDAVNISIVNWFKSVSYDVQANNKTVQETLSSIVFGIQRFQVKAKASGTWDKLNWGVSSTLGKKLASGVKGQVKEKVKEAKKKARRLVDEKIGPKKKALAKKYVALKNKLTEMLRSKDKEVTAAKDKAINSGTKAAPTPKDKAKGLFKKLGKKFKF